MQMWDSCGPLCQSAATCFYAVQPYVPEQVSHFISESSLEHKQSNGISTKESTRKDKKNNDKCFSKLPLKLCPALT